MSDEIIKFKKMSADAITPTKKNYEDAGFDLHANESNTILSRDCFLIETGIAMQIPKGYVGIIKSRSGLACNYNLDVLGGIIDSGFLGSVKVILFNHGPVNFNFKKGDRIAQIIFMPVILDATEVTELDDSDRGEDGFGSSGK